MAPKTPSYPLSIQAHCAPFMMSTACTTPQCSLHIMLSVLHSPLDHALSQNTNLTRLAAQVTSWTPLHCPPFTQSLLFQYSPLDHTTLWCPNHHQTYCASNLMTTTSNTYSQHLQHSPHPQATSSHYTCPTPLQMPPHMHNVSLTDTHPTASTLPLQ